MSSCVAIVGRGFLGGEGERSRLNGGQGGSVGGPEGNPEINPGGVEGGGLLAGSAGPAAGAGGGGDAARLRCASRSLMSGVVGTVGGRCRRKVRAGFRRNGLPSAGCD